MVATLDFGTHLLEWKSDGESGSSLRIAAQCATEHFYTLAHAAQAVPFLFKSTASIIFNPKTAGSILLREIQTAGARLSVAHDVCNGFPHGHG